MPEYELLRPSVSRDVIFFSFQEEKLFGQAETEYVHFMLELSLLQEGQEKGKEAGRQCQGLVGG